MKVFEHSAQRLRLRLGIWGVSGGTCTLDRDNNVADITRYTLAIPYYFKRVALTEITGIGVKRKGPKKAYCPVFELKSGQNMSIGQYRKEDAIDAVRAIRDFLKMTR